MRIVITDACIFIDVIDLQLTGSFFNLGLEIHITHDVFNERYPAQQQILVAYQRAGKLTIHVLSSQEQRHLFEENFPTALSPEDRSVIYIARKIDATVLSSDKAVRKYARKLAIDYHGMIWLFDQLVGQALLTKAEAIVKLKKLVAGNMMYRGNADLLSEVAKREKAWT